MNRAKKEKLTKAVSLIVQREIEKGVEALRRDLEQRQRELVQRIIDSSMERITVDPEHAKVVVEL